MHTQSNCCRENPFFQGRVLGLADPEHVREAWGAHLLLWDRMTQGSVNGSDRTIWARLGSRSWESWPDKPWHCCAVTLVLWLRSFHVLRSICPSTRTLAVVMSLLQSKEKSTFERKHPAQLQDHQNVFILCTDCLKAWSLHQAGLTLVCQAACEG